MELHPQDPPSMMEGSFDAHLPADVKHLLNLYHLIFGSFKLGLDRARNITNYVIPIIKSDAHPRRSKFI